MITLHKASSIAFLRWSLGLVVLWESCRFAASPASIHHLQRMGLPVWIAPVLGGIEVVASVIFLIPRLRRVGGYCLLAIFAIAAMLHILHRQFEIGSLLVYGAATLACVHDSLPRDREVLS
ncbi:MAG TPA: DoxX family protein [Terriglobales bacterium]